MLPRVLCESLCSLEPGADRLAFSCEWWVDAAGRPVGDARFFRSVIRSAAKLAYSDAQAMIDAAGEEAAAAAGRAAFESRAAALPDASRPPPVAAAWTDLAADTRALWGLAQARRAARFAAGALRLDNTKLIFRLAPDGAPTSAHPHVHGEANQLVEEWMLAANGAAAARLAAHAPTRALLRRHPPPAERKLAEVAEAVLGAVGVSLDVSSAGALHTSLAAAAAALPADAAAALTLLCTKPMQLATYDCAGAVEGGVGAMGHYALAMSLYTHFTSPIRRYPDVLVHRMLAATLEADSGGSADPGDDAWWHARGVGLPAAVAAAAAHCNERKLAAKAVQDASSRLFLADLVKRAPRVAVAVATAVGGARFFDCHVPALGVDVRVSVEEAVTAGVLLAGWDGGEKTLTLRKGERRGGGGGDAFTLPPLHNPDGLTPLVLPITVSLLTALPVVVTAEGGGRGGGAALTAALLVEGVGAWAAAAAAGPAPPAEEGSLSVVDDLAGAD